MDDVAKEMFNREIVTVNSFLAAALAILAGERRATVRAGFGLPERLGCVHHVCEKHERSSCLL